jgi:hypothetical protein
VSAPPGLHYTSYDLNGPPEKPIRLLVTSEPTPICSLAFASILVALRDQAADVDDPHHTTIVALRNHAEEVWSRYWATCPTPEDVATGRLALEAWGMESRAAWKARQEPREPWQTDPDAWKGGES